MVSKTAKSPLSLLPKANSRIIAPSILSADFSKLGEEIKAVESAGADWIHVDVMDGQFVPNLTIGPPVVKSLRKITKLPLDCHLMVVQPELLVASFAAAGADIITIHQEACAHLHKTLQSIKDLGIRAGVSINPSTPVATLQNVLHIVDLVLVMSVNPGFGGQSFIKETLIKVSELAKIKTDNNYSFIIEIDGGISPTTITAAAQAGCQAFVAGSAIFGSAHYERAITALREA